MNDNDENLGQNTIVHGYKSRQNRQIRENTKLEPPPPPEDDLKNTMPLSRKALVDNLQVKKKAYLEIHGIEDEPIGVELGRSDCIIGRTSDNDLQVPLDDVSRQHARIFCRKEEYYIEDLGSTNGTFVNGISVVKCVLRNNDQIEIGDAKIIFVEVETRSG